MKVATVLTVGQLGPLRGSCQAPHPLKGASRGGQRAAVVASVSIPVRLFNAVHGSCGEEQRLSRSGGWLVIGVGSGNSRVS